MKNSSQSKLTFEFLKGREALIAIKDEWNVLLNDNPQRHDIFLTHEWNLIWADVFCENLSKIVLLIGRDGDELVLILPLLYRVKFGLKQLRWMGDPVSQYGAVLFDAKLDMASVMRDVIDFMPQHYNLDLLVLPAVAENTPLYAGLQRIKVYQYGSHKGPVIDLSDFERVEDYWKTRSKSANKQRRRLRRKLALEQGEVCFRIVKGSDPEIVDLMQATLQLKQKNLQDNQIYSSAFATGKMEQFFQKIAESNYQGLLISEFSCGGKVVALEVGFERKGTYVSHIGVYDSDYARYSPGKIQMSHTIDALFGMGIKVIDLLPPPDGYKYIMANKTETVFDFGVPFSLKGRIYLKTILQRLRPFAKEVKTSLVTKQMPPSIKKMLPSFSENSKSRD